MLGSISRMVPVMLAFAAVAPSAASAVLPRTYQVVTIENPAPSAGDRFGDGLVNAGDVNGDGKDDILVGIDEHAMVEGEVFVFSGADGSLIRRIPPPDPDAINGGVQGNPDNVAAFGTFVGKIADIGGCPGFAGPLGGDCTAPVAVIDTPDGVPDQLASAIGVDLNDAQGDDMGMAYVLDGATGAVLKRIRMPEVHRTEQAANAPTASQGPGFGRTILSPSGQPPCAGFGGLAAKRLADGSSQPRACAYAAGSAVARGDLDGAGRPDIGIGASDFTDREGSSATSNPRCADADPATTVTCFQSGRYFVYRGEALLGLEPDEPLETAFYVIKNPAAQPDTGDVNSRFHREALGYSVAPVGDLGTCTAGPVAGELCLNARNTVTPDGRPEFILSAHRADFAGIGDAGVAFAVDGPTGAILDVYNPPEPQPSSIFGFSNYNQPAVGDLGSTIAPDVYQSGMIHNVAHRAQGRGWVLTGDFRGGGANHYEIAVLDDPTPSQIGNFGTSSAGVGDLTGDFHTELAIGAYGPHAPQVVDDVISDVHIFTPLGEKALQTISDPAQQPGSGFGRALAPLGDLNGDGFLDLAVGAGGYDPGPPENCSPCPGVGLAQGRIYILRSDNSPAPVQPAAPQPGVATAPTRAGRSLELSATRASIRRGRRVLLRGVLETFADEAGCVPGQLVELQRRTPGSARHRTFRSVRTDNDGDFSLRVRPGRTTLYRARVDETATCLGAVSNRERVGVRRRRAAR